MNKILLERDNMLQIILYLALFLGILSFFGGGGDDEENHDDEYYYYDDE